MTGRGEKPSDPRRVIDANHRGMRITGWIWTVEGILLIIAAAVTFFYKLFH